MVVEKSERQNKKREKIEALFKSSRTWREFLIATSSQVWRRNIGAKAFTLRNAPL